MLLNGLLVSLLLCADACTELHPSTPAHKPPAGEGSSTTAGGTRLCRVGLVCATPDLAAEDTVCLPRLAHRCGQSGLHTTLQQVSGGWVVQTSVNDTPNPGTTRSRHAALSCGMQGCWGVDEVS
jgi:hypothetical protein